MKQREEKEDLEARGFKIYDVRFMNMRPTWDEYFMMAAKLIAVMATCPKLRVGSVIVKNRRIVASGFNGAPPGQAHCTEVGCLVFEDEGTSCRRVVHSEHNAVLQDSGNVAGGTLYTPYLPCIDCMKAVISAKIAEVVYESEYQGHKNRYQMSREFALQSGIKLRRIREVRIVDILSKYYDGFVGNPEVMASNFPPSFTS